MYLSNFIYWGGGGDGVGQGRSLKASACNFTHLSKPYKSYIFSSLQVIDQESALKATIGGLTGMDQSLTSTISTMVSPATSNTISKLPVTSSAESLTNVYSIIMDDGMYMLHM